MKILTKLLNLIVVILVAIGIFSIVYFFVKIKPQNEEYEKVLEENSSLQYRIDIEIDKNIKLDYAIFEANEIIKERENTISNLKDENERIIAETNKQIEELKDQSLEQIVELIKSHYGITNSDIEIKTINDSIKIVIKPRLCREWATSLTKLESAQIRLKTYKNQVLAYDSLVNDYKYEIDLLEQKDSIYADIVNMEQEKNSNFQKLLDNRNKMIKSLKVQRGIAGGIIAVVVMLAIL
jgi:hypothetical protein